MMKTLASQRGFTLIELMVTVAVVAVLMLVAAPGYSSFQRNSELTSRANSLLAAINAARGEAMKRGSYATVVPLNGTQWNSGWIVFVDVNRNGVYDSGTDIQLYTADALPNYLSLVGNGNAGLGTPYVSFDASGYSKTIGQSFGNLTLEFSRTDVATTDYSQIRRVKVATTGRVRVCTPISGSDLTCTMAASL